MPLSALLLAAVLACDTGGDRTSGFEARDSAGVRITVSSDYQWPEGEGWRLSDQPHLDIGTLEGEDHYQFFRIINAVTLGDGRIVVANSGTNELRFFDSQGAFLFSSGRKGGGPGEFEALWTISALASDSVMAFDRRLRRMSVFAPDGTFARSFMFTSLAGGASLPMPLGLTADGNLVVSERAFGTGETRTGFTRDSTYYLLVDKNGALIDTLGFFPDSEWYIKTEGEAIYSSTPPFARSSESAVHGTGFYFGSSESYEISYYSATGIFERLIRRERPNLDVTAEDLERYRQGILERTRDPSRRQFWQSMFAEMPVPETMPAYGSMLVDAEGNLWVGEYRRPGDDQPRWTVFDPDGVMLGVVETPERFRVYEIGSDYVLGRGADELDVQHIQIYGLLKN
jgi:hypothetical protein